jgi:flagellar assembly protein FliH
MTSTSPDGVVLRDVPHGTVASSGPGQDLRSGRWTRLGHPGVLGDTVAEATLQALAERTQAAAQAQGYATGWAQGFRVAREQSVAGAEAEQRHRDQERARFQAEQNQAVVALHQAVERLDTAYRDATAAITGQAVDLALQVAQAILDREIDRSDDPGADALRRALALLPTGSPVVVRLHPEDRARLDTAAFDGDTVRLVDDPTLARGDAVAEADDVVVDATVAAALDRVRQVLVP